jgi:hypothetical protein
MRGRLLAPAIVLVFCAGLRAAAADATEIRGSVSFVAESSVYITTGRAQGVEVGAEVRVVRGGKTVARLRVEAVSSGSAAAVAVDLPGEVRPGDMIVVVVRAGPPRTAAPRASPGAPAGPLPSPEELEVLWTKAAASGAPLAKVPYRGRGAVSGRATATKAAAPAAPRVEAEPAANVAHGSISVGYFGSYDSSPDSADHTYHAPRASAAVTVERILGEPLTLRIRGDARAILEDQDRVNRSGTHLDRRISLTELSLTWSPASVPLRVSAGRTFASPAAQTGIVDGARVSLVLGAFEAGGFGGLDAAPNLDDRRRTKLGAFVTFRTPPGADLDYQASVAFVQTGEGGTADRRLVALDQRLFLAPWLSAFHMVEIDLYGGTENPAGRPSVDLTDLYLGLRARPLEWLDIGVSYDRRRPFYGALEAEDIFPATPALVDDDPRQTLRGDARLALPARSYVRVFGDRRLGAGDGVAAGGELGCDDLGGVHVALGGSYTRTRYVRGPAFYARASTFLLERLSASASYTLSFDDYRDGRGRVVRHEPRISLDYLLSTAFSLQADVGYEFGDEVRRATLALSLTYRF